jgi:putative N6-adenine-specific DNA methylase
MARANIMLRIAERVLIELGSFRAESFSELFDNVSAMLLRTLSAARTLFPVKGWSLNSKLHSVPDCQSIIKKAIVNRLEKKYGVQWFEESGPARQIQFSIMKDMVSISIDTSGAGLHKRGYRPKSLAAPIKETLAAGIADLARVREDSLVLDPMCGSGTLLIEAAMKAMQIPPGLKRRFAAESWGVFPKSVWQQERRAGYETVRRSAAFRAWDGILTRTPYCAAGKTRPKPGWRPGFGGTSGYLPLYLAGPALYRHMQSPLRRAYVGDQGGGSALSQDGGGF